MILVTGGTGLVGSHLLVHLSFQNEPIRAIYRSTSSLEKVKKVFLSYTNDATFFEKIEWFLADITDVPSMIPAFFGVKQVYHCAAFISFNPKDYREMRKINIHGTAIVVNLAIDAKVEKFCYVSSIAAVGESLTNDMITEENEWNKELDNSGYSITKFGAEMEVWRASQEGIPVIVVNPGVILGSGFWDSGSGKLFSQIYNSFQFYTDGITGFVSVKDVVKAMILLMKSELKNERFILVSENKSFKEVFFSIADAFGLKRPARKIIYWQTEVFWRIAWLISKITQKDPLISKYSARSAHHISYYSSDKIKKILNFEFENIENIVQEMVSKYPKNKELLNIF
ncbi:MAG: NAD-dependent epimerase/dehydratase family protein [Flavobacteriia bacterium]|nr:NAD-dependent epimerase/dehydratase family protein [Flavobacteriia bacterium]PIV97409.1 MAG: NAD-dependent epimerase [Flavobacteriaceae bacterium CG17_big_fil_post_rev_8_21_14_2_50_31_13]PIX11792.1 MAG: NAD-dependent epimerase [Flavobacteriaceae bacterium CG_4_8_14_3_um_filter_31_8]PIY14768.1 MAG: NAD-dependent epimerase [Flavobacteriaceae bacterium CG_4_10_14_3_um_filter_31_253]PIZ12116.1 MAG: NAD-dependent epimerase [Flavobacteriaceae bacterium CG_4_10_14_0_8_um_filter_31_99]PJC08853.1 MA